MTTPRRPKSHFEEKKLSDALPPTGDDALTQKLRSCVHHPPPIVGRAPRKSMTPAVEKRKEGERWRRRRRRRTITFFLVVLLGAPSPPPQFAPGISLLIDGGRGNCLGDIFDTSSQKRKNEASSSSSSPRDDTTPVMEVEVISRDDEKNLLRGQAFLLLFF